MTARRVSKILVLALGLAMLLIAPQAADAQDSELRYPGTLSDEVLSAQVSADAAPTSVSGADKYGTFSDGTNLSFVAPDAQPGDGPAAGTTGSTGGTGGGLAVTGSSVEPIVAISIGFLAVGTSAVVSSRRRLRDLLG